MTDHQPSTANVVAVASGKGGVGKTTAAVDLAAALAEQGQETVVVDCDLDVPDLGRVLDLAPETTLHDVLAGTASIEDAIAEAGGFAAVTGHSDLDMFAAADPDLLAGAVARLREQFDAVVLDTGSNLQSAEPALRIADAAVLATTPDPPAIAAARRTADLVRRLDAEVVGGVVARTDAEPFDAEEAVAQLDWGTTVVVPADRPSGPVVATDPGGESATAFRRLASAVSDSAADTPVETGDWPTETDATDPSEGHSLTDEKRTKRGGRLSALADVVFGRRAPAIPRQVSYDPDHGLSVSRRAVVASVVAFQIFLFALIFSDPPIPLLRPIVGGIYGLFVPGLLVALLLDLDRCSFTRLLLYSVGLSTIVILAVGAVISLGYPAVGIENPFREGTVVSTLLLVVFGLCSAILARDEERPFRIPVHTAFAPAPLALALVPFVSVFGITFQNATGNNSVLLTMLILLSVLPILTALGKIPSRWLSLAVWATAAALVYHSSLFGPSIGGPSGSAATLDGGVWFPSEESVLPNGVLFPTFVLLTGLRLGIEVVTVNPLLVSFLPVILFEGYREQIGDRGAFASACLFMFSFPFYVLYPSAGRVATPVYFLALEGLVLSDGDVDLFRKRILGIAFGMGLAVSHYGTAYVALVAFEVAFVAYVAFNLIDWLRSPSLRGDVLQYARFDSAASGLKSLTPQLLSTSFIGFYIVFVVEWYFYTSGGEKFVILPRKVISVVNRFFEASASGTAASTVSKDYGSTAIAMSRRLYIVIGALMGIGLAATVLARVVRKDSVEIDDEFLALGVGYMSMLGTSFFVVGFNIARIMMIVFTFTAIYVVYGFGSIVEGLRTAHRVVETAVGGDLRGTFDRLLGVDFGRALGASRLDVSAIATLLCVFLLLNTGVVTVFFTHDYAPSNIVTQQQLERSEEVQVQLKSTGCVACDIESHVWLFAHRNRSNYAYGDFMAWAQVDFFRGPIAGRLSYFPKKVTYRSLWSASNGTEGQALILLLDHNTDIGIVLIESKYQWESLDEMDPVLGRSHKVYTTGETEIYRSTDRATEREFDNESRGLGNETENGTLENGTAENATTRNETIPVESVRRSPTLRVGREPPRTPPRLPSRPGAEPRLEPPRVASRGRLSLPVRP